MEDVKTKIEELRAEVARLNVRVEDLEEEVKRLDHACGGNRYPTIGW